MKRGGQLRLHVYEKSWLSESIDVNVPPKLPANNGSLVVSLGEEKDVKGTRSSD